MLKLGIDLLNLIYPIGSIYMSVNGVNPSTIFGGTWASWGSGRVPVGVDTSQTEFNTVGKTGGAKTHTLTVDEMPSHTHTSIDRMLLWDAGKTGMFGTVGTSGTQYVQSSGWGGSVVNNTGGGQAHNNLQPYICVYMWKRTA